MNEINEKLYEGLLLKRGIVFKPEKGTFLIPPSTGNIIGKFSVIV